MGCDCIGVDLTRSLFQVYRPVLVAWDQGLSVTTLDCLLSAIHSCERIPCNCCALQFYNSTEDTPQANIADDASWFKGCTPGLWDAVHVVALFIGC